MSLYVNSPARQSIRRIYRVLPARARRRAFTTATALIAPRPDEASFAVRPGLAVAGDLAKATGLGEGARLMLRGLQGCGIDAWPLDLAAPDARLPPPGVPLVIHVNAPWLPHALLRLPRGVLRGRRVIGYWAWELPAVPCYVS